MIGGGPAGLFAAETAAQAGAAVTLYEAKPSVGRKFLVAGRGGLNLTHGEAMESFVERYQGPDLPVTAWREALHDFDPNAIRTWASGLGIDTFQASSGRVYPREMKAAPLLRRWVERLRSLHVELQMKHRLVEIHAGKLLELTFSTPDGLNMAQADAVILALGGGSWSITGSDGAWVPLLEKHGVLVHPLVSANCGWECVWPEEIREVIEGQPLKNMRAFANGKSAVGELMITRYGLEGGIIYQLGAALRSMPQPEIVIDLKPDFTHEQLMRKAESVKRNLVSAAAERWRLSAAATALVSWQAEARAISCLSGLVDLVKQFSLSLDRPRPLEEAISSAGGVAWQSLDESWQLRALPGVFVAGEMIDWEAPTGGYLMQGCFASGRRAAMQALAL